MVLRSVGLGHHAHTPSRLQLELAPRPSSESSLSSPGPLMTRGQYSHTVLPAIAASPDTQALSLGCCSCWCSRPFHAGCCWARCALLHALLLCPTTAGPPAALLLLWSPYALQRQSTPFTVLANLPYAASTHLYKMGRKHFPLACVLSSYRTLPHGCLGA